MTTYAQTSIATLPLDRPASRATRTLFIAACLLTALAGRLAYLQRSFDYDAATFIYLGKSVCDGLRFGYDIIDNKFPTVGLMLSIVWRAFGTNWACYVLLQTALSFGGAVMLARCAARNVGEHTRIPTLLAGLIYLNFTSAVYGGFQLETLQIFFSILAGCCAVEAFRSRSTMDAVTMGLAVGCAGMIKPTGLAPLGAFAITLLLVPGHTRLLAAALLGLSIPLGVAVRYLVATDILHDMPKLYQTISLYASQTPFAWQDMLRPIVVIVLAGFGIFVRGRIYRREPHRTGTPPQRAIVLFGVIWFGLELIGAVLQRRMYMYHFLPVAAPAALLFGILPRRASTGQLLAALSPIMALSLASAMRVTPYPNPPAPVLPVSAWLQAHARPGDAIWQDQSARTLLETGLRPGSRFIALFMFGNYDLAPQEYLPMLLGDFDRNRPRFIILPTDLDAKLQLEVTQASHLSRSPERAKYFCYAWREIQEYVREHYTRETAIGSETIYVRSN